MAINLIDIGATANDGSGDPIRSAFQTVNNNFDFINGGLFAGSEASTISAVSVTGGVIVSNTSVTANSTTSNNVVVTGALGGNLFVQSNGAYIIGNVTVIGNLSVTGAQAAAQAQASTASLLNLHYQATPLILNDNRDIGLVWQYYKAGPEKKAFLGWQNSTESLVYFDDITENISNVITSGTPGNVQIGSLLIANSTVATSNTTGALKVTGGGSIGGNLYVAGNVVSTFANIGNLAVTGYHVGDLNFTGADTVYINGSPVQTAAQAFNGGTIALQTTVLDTSQSTSAVSGAFQVRGGAGIAGNIWAGNIHANIGGNVRANIQGNIFTAAQPFITSLGALTGLDINGQLNVNDISPNANQVYSLGTATSDRWLKLWAYDADLSGAITLTGELTASSNIHINRSGIAALRTTTSIAEVFNTSATIVRIGGDGITEFDNNTQATSTSTGAIQLTGGMSINSGNLYISGSAGNSLITTGAVSINSNTQSTSTTTGALKVNGGISITSGNLYISGSAGAAIVATGNILPSGNVVSTNNIGSDTAWWNNFYGKSIQAQYADLAEIYKPDHHYEYGTVVVFGGEAEITVTNEFADHRVAGVISQNPAYLMNATLEGLPVALRGRVPVRVVGTVAKGDLLVTSTTPGYARSVGSDIGFGVKIFAKALEATINNRTNIIEAVII